MAEVFVNSILTGRVTQVRSAEPYKATVSRGNLSAFALGNFQLTESGELRIFEDGEPAELG